MTTPSRTLARKIPGTGEPGRLPLMGSQRVGHYRSNLAAAAAAALQCCISYYYTANQIRGVCVCVCVCVCSAQSCPTLCNPMSRSTPGLPVHHQLPEFTQTHVHRVSDAIQRSHPLASPSPPAPNPSQHQSLFQ